MTILRDPVRRRSTFPTYLSKAQEEQAEKCGICVLTFSVCQMFNGVQSGLVLDKRKQNKTPIRVVLLSHLPTEHVCAFVSNAGNGRRARREQGTVVQRSKPHMFFVSYVCFLSQLCLHPPVHTETRGEKKTHPSPL